jgi:flavin-dependent dehydrogenase
VVDDRRSVLVVGASAAGLRCACRLARLKPHWAVRVIDARERISYAACGLPYVLSGDIGEPEALRRTDYGATRDADYFSRCKGVRKSTRGTIWFSLPGLGRGAWRASPTTRVW